MNKSYINSKCNITNNDKTVVIIPQKHRKITGSILKVGKTDESMYNDENDIMYIRKKVG